DEGPYVFRQFTPTGAKIPRLQTVDDLEGDDLLYYDAEMEVMNIILLSIPNEIYNSVDSCTSVKDMWKQVEPGESGESLVDRETRVEKDTHVHDLCALETFARNAYEEAAKQQRLAQKGYKKMKDAFEQNDVYLDEIERQNDLLKDQLLEASLKHDIELCVLLNHECVDKSLHDELEQVKKKSLEILEGMNATSSVKRPKSSAFTYQDQIPKSSKTTFVAPKTRFSKKATQSKTLDTTSVASKSKIDEASASKARDKWLFKHMRCDRFSLRNFIEKFMGTVRFGNDNFAAITGYGDYIHGNITICHVYYVEGLGHNLFSVGQFCDGDLEVAFRYMACFFFTILSNGQRQLQHKSWLWASRLSHLNFGTINDLTKLDLVDGLPKFKYGKDHLCSACERGKSKKASHPPKLIPSDYSKLELLHMDLCGPMRVASVNGKKYIYDSG
ncbi:integrase, catalytic region, zinc finger, CCHC-type containing protein, partial [Tanacetum coccineum]